jgi:hypothetical protein
LDHYLVVAKVKLGRGNTLKYVIQNRPMALDLLTVYVPNEPKDFSSATKQRSSISNTDSNDDTLDDSIASSTSDPHPRKRPSSILPYVNLNHPNSPMVLRPLNDLSQHDAPLTMTSTTILHDRDRKNGYPIVFEYLGRRSHGDLLVLYATSDAIRKPWIDKIIKQQLERQRRNKPIFETTPAVEVGHFGPNAQVNHIVTFSKYLLPSDLDCVLILSYILDEGRQFILASEDGVYVGHTSGRKKPHKVLSLLKVTQIQVVESAQMLLILSDRTLWEYGLDAVNGKPDTQPLGTRVQTHVPFFYVGRSLQRTVVCVPRVSTLNSTITTFEPVGKDMVDDSSTKPEVSSNKHSDGMGRRKSIGLLDKVALRVGAQQQQRQHRSQIRLKRLKVFYVPCEVWAIELSPSKMLVTSPRGMIMLDMKTDKPQRKLSTIPGL